MNFLKEVVIGDHYLKNDVVEFHVNSEGAVQLDPPSFKHAAGGISLWDFSGTEGKFVLWKAKNNELYLHEHSLACNQSTKSRKYVFGNEVLLPEVYLREFDNNLVVLVATNCAVYRILFTCQRNQTRSSRGNSRLPSNFLNQQHSNLFAFVYASDLGSHQVLSASFYHHSSHTSSFVLSCNKEFIIRIEMGENGTCNVVKKSFAPNLVDFIYRKKSHSTLSSIVMLPAEFSHLLLGLDSSGTLHGITLSGLNLFLEKDLCTLLPFHSQLMVPEQMPNHVLKKVAPGCEKSDHTLLIAYLQFEHVKCFLLLELLQKEAKVECLAVIQVGGMTGHALVDFCLTPDTLYAIWESNGELSVKFVHYKRSVVWKSLGMSAQPESVVPIDHVKDVQGVFLDYIMSGVFPTNTLIDVAMEMKSRQQTDDVTEIISTRKDLRRAIIECVEAEIQSNLLNYELQHEEYRKVLTEHWQLFYSLLHEHYVNDMRPIGFVTGIAASLNCLVYREAVSFLLPLDPVEQIWHCSTMTAHERKLSLHTLPKDVTLTHYNSFLNYLAVVKDIVRGYKIGDYISSSLCKGKPTRIVVESCFKLYKEALSENEAKQLRDIHHACISWKALPDILRYICAVLSATFVSTEEVPEANFEDSFTGATRSDQLLRMSVSQNVLSIVDNSHALACALALLIGSLADKAARNVQVLYQEEICSHVYNLTVLKWIVHQEVATSNVMSCPNDEQNMVLLSAGSNKLFHSDETMMDSFSDMKLNAAKETKFSSAELKCKLVKTTLLTDFIDCLLDEIIHTNISRKPSLQNKKNFTKLIEGVSSDIVKQLCPAGSLVPFAKYLTVKNPMLASDNPIIVLQYCQILDQEFKLDAVHLYLRFKSYLELNEPRKAWQVCQKLIVRNVGFGQLLKLRQLDDVLKLKLDLIVSFEELNFFEEAVKLLSLVCDQLTPTENSGKTHLMADSLELIQVIWTKKFKCCLEIENFKGCYDCLLDIRKVSQEVFKDCLQCWVVALSAAKHKKLLTSFNCAFMEDDIVDILEKKARTSNVLTQRFYQTLYNFHIAYRMYRSAAVVMLERASRLQNEIHAAVAEESLREELVSWNNCYLCLRSCPPEDQRLIMPTFEYYVQGSKLNIAAPEVKTGSNDSNEEPELRAIGLVFLKDVYRFHYICQMKNELVDAELEKDLLLSSKVSDHSLMLLLVKQGFFTRAIHLCEVCEMDASVVFETMANMYCKSLSSSSTQGKKRTTTCDWINRNTLSLDVIMATYNGDKLLLLIKECLEKRTSKLPMSHRKKYCTVVLIALLHNQKEPPFWLNTMIQRMDPMKLSEIYLRFGYLFMSVRFAKSHLESNITRLQVGNPSENQNLYTNPKLYIAIFSVLSKREDPESRIAHDELKELWDSYLEKLEC